MGRLKRACGFDKLESELLRKSSPGEDPGFGLLKLL